MKNIKWLGIDLIAVFFSLFFPPSLIFSKKICQSFFLCQLSWLYWTLSLVVSWSNICMWEKRCVFLACFSITEIMMIFCLIHVGFFQNTQTLAYIDICHASAHGINLIHDSAVCLPSSSMPEAACASVLRFRCFSCISGWWQESWTRDIPTHTYIRNRRKHTHTDTQQRIESNGYMYLIHNTSF